MENKNLVKIIIGFTAVLIVGITVCQGIELLVWRHPSNKGLEYLIEENGLYPITILPSLKGHLKDVLVSKEVILVKDILATDTEKLSKRLGISPKYLYSLISEARTLFGL